MSEIAVWAATMSWSPFSVLTGTLLCSSVPPGDPSLPTSRFGAARLGDQGSLQPEEWGTAPPRPLSLSLLTGQQRLDLSRTQPRALHEVLGFLTGDRPGGWIPFRSPGQARRKPGRANPSLPVQDEHLRPHPPRIVDLLEQANRGGSLAQKVVDLVQRVGSAGRGH